MMESHGITGRWQNESKPELIKDYVAGLLVTRDDRGKETRGQPEAFFTRDGESGIEVLGRVLAPPDLLTFRAAVRRECLAAAHYVALFGIQETRAVDGSDYIVDTGEGSCAAIRFTQEGCVGALVNYDPWRPYDVQVHLPAIPESLRSAASSVCTLPFLNSPDQAPISSLFWSSGGELTADEPWYVVYKFGGEILRRELLRDGPWLCEASNYYGLPQNTLSLTADIARRTATLDSQLTMTTEEFDLIAPLGCPHREDALRLIGNVGFTP